MFYHKVFGIIVFGLLTCVSQTAGDFLCYKCSSKVDELCVDKPEQISNGETTVNCKETSYCTILRTEFTDVPGQVVSFVRDCEEKPLILNDIRTDAHYTKYYRSCKTNICNGGDGIIGGGSNSNAPKNILLVPEQSGSNSRYVSPLSSSSIWISIFSTLTLLILSHN